MKAEKMKMPKEKPRIDLNFPKDGQVQPEGFSGLGVDEDVTVIVRGKVTRLEDSADEWTPGKHVTVRIASCEFQTTEKGVGIDEAVKAGMRRV